MKLKLTFTVDAAQVMTQGFSDTARDLRLERDGSIVIPIDLGNGMFMGRPAPCGTWELTDD